MITSHVIPDAGHCVHQEKHALVAQYIHAFLQSLPHQPDAAVIQMDFASTHDDDDHVDNDNVQVQSVVVKVADAPSIIMKKPLETKGPGSTARS